MRTVSAQQKTIKAKTKVKHRFYGQGPLTSSDVKPTAALRMRIVAEARRRLLRRDRRCWDFVQQSAANCKSFRGILAVFACCWTPRTCFKFPNIARSAARRFRRQKRGSAVYKQNAASCCLRWHDRDRGSNNTHRIPDCFSQITWCCQRWKSPQTAS